MSVSNPPTMGEAVRRYFHDPEFHARVYTAVQAVMLDDPRRDGFDGWHRDSVIAGASMALQMVDRGYLDAVMAAMDNSR